MKIRDIIDREQETLSMEVFPPKKDTDFEMVKEAALHIASLKPSFMSVTYGAGGSTKGNTIKLASEIQKQYQVPAMAHLTCVCATKESINTALTEMKQAGIENILALRGDIPKDYDGEVFTEFQHASQLVELIKKTGDLLVVRVIQKYTQIPRISLMILMVLRKRLRQAVNFLQHRCSLIITFSLTLCTG